jgi:hypothetical protein
MNDKSEKAMKNLTLTLKIEAACSSEALVCSQKVTLYNNYRDCSLNMKYSNHDSHFLIGV